MRNLMIASCFLFSMACAVQADEFAIKLKEGAGKDLTQVQCSACHSLDYIQMNSPFLGQAAWQAGKLDNFVAIQHIGAVERDVAGAKRFCPDRDQDAPGFVHINLTRRGGHLDMGRVEELKNSEDRLEAAAARKEKRKPVFKGR